MFTLQGGDHILFKVWEKVKGFQANLYVFCRDIILQKSYSLPSEAYVRKAGLMIMSSTRKWLVTVISSER